MLAAIFELIFYFVIEIVFEAIGEMLAEGGLNVFGKARESRTVGPIFRTLTYVVVGSLLGILSYFVLPVHIVQSSFLRAAGSVISIVSMGFMLCLISWVISRKDRHEPFWSTEKFIHGVVFGASYSLSRAFAVG